ncbi:hypothetical protein BJ875DRAFT_384188, partial [Amylocarpus encephaloides]
NTWFDSPVMSRTHAEMVLNTSKNPTVVLRDIGSMHGTRINQTTLARDQDAQINSGDILVFGAEVRRAQEVFPACRFLVNLDFATYHVNGSSIPSPQRYKPAKSVDPIDLTKDETPARDSSMIDLTVDASPPATSLPDLDVAGVVAGGPIVFEEKEELYDDLSSVSEDPSEISESEMPESDGLGDLDDEDMQEDSDSDEMDVDEARKMTDGVESIRMAMDDDDSNFGLSDAGPSPSDAALVKMAPPKPANDMVTFPLRVPEAGQDSASLGEKSGKHAYFEAREQNKSKVSTSIDAKADLATIQIPTLESKSWAGTGAGKDDALVNDVLNVTSGSSANTTSIFSTSAAMGINSSLRDPFGMKLSTVAERRNSPEYDMTSAVTFNESKAKAIRSRLSIHDIIDTASREESPGVGGRLGGKRKASEISDTIQDEVRAWAKNSTVPSQISDKVSTTPEMRSVKRLKTFMERATYAAVGGVAVGAGLFFSLVATAPNFA